MEFWRGTGRKIRHIHDGDQQAQGSEWVLPNIFAPYRSEYDIGAEFGSLWDSWLMGMKVAVATLTERYSAPNGTEKQASGE
jgi:hypothetical protein